MAAIDDHGTCEGCGTARLLAPSLGTYCPNDACDFDHKQMLALLREHTQSEVERLARALHLADEPRGEPLSVDWEGLLEGTRERYLRYARVARAFR